MLSRRGLEALTAALTGAFGAAVVVSSVQSGISWSSSGVGPGTFPCLAGALIFIGSVYNAARGMSASRQRWLSAKALQRLVLLFLPAAAFVAAIPLAGLHVAAAGYVFATLVLQQRIAAARAGALALATAVALYFVFDRMFQVPLPRGALGVVLGF